MLMTVNRRPKTQAGFTLIELMISLVLGLLISAAVVQIYLTNVKTATVQRSGSDLQDASIFGIQQLESHIRLANLGNSVTKITDGTSGGGIVLSLTNLGLPATSTTMSPYLSHTAGDSSWTSVSNTNVNSDQLTIQFTNITGKVMSDCESADIATGATVIERYFVRQVTGDTSTGAVKNLALVCDAGRISGTTISGLNSDYQTGGNELITGVDQFKVLIGVQDTANQLMYLPSSTYVSLTTTHPSIVAVRLGLIVHGSTPILGSSDKSSFTLLGQTNTLKTDTTRKKMVRTTYESTTLLRNARVVKVTP